MSNDTAVADLNPVLESRAENTSTHALVMDTQGMAMMQDMAKQMAAAKVTVPKHLAESPGDCLAVIMQAMQWGMNPFAVAQKTHLVNGTLGYEAQLVNAVISSSSLLTSRINYSYEGDWKNVSGKTCKDDALAVTVSATLKGESEPRALRVSMAQVGETRNSPMWVTDPRQQLAYLATKRWARLHAPDVLLGVYTPDELEDHQPRDMGPAQREGEPAPLPEYPADQFAENLPKWKELIAAGKKSADQIVAMVSTKYRLSDDQVAAIKADPETGETEAPDTAEPQADDWMAA